MVKGQRKKTAIEPDIQDKFDQKTLAYIKSPYSNSLVAGYNVWRFDDDSDPICKAKKTETIEPTLRRRTMSDKQKDRFHARLNSFLIGPPLQPTLQRSLNNSTDQVAQLSTQLHSSCLMSRFQDAPVFVPGRTLHSSQMNVQGIEEKRRLTPEPHSTQLRHLEVEKSASNKSLNTSESALKPESTRLPNMSFDELRVLAAEMRKQKEEGHRESETSKENNEGVSSDEPGDSDYP